MGENKKGVAPPGLADWEALYPKLFEVHGQPIGEMEALAAALEAAREQGHESVEALRELLEIMRQHPIRVRRKPDGWLYLRWPVEWERKEVAPVLDRASELFHANKEAIQQCWINAIRVE